MKKIFAYDIYLDNQYLDTVFYSIREPSKEVYNSLVNHDGYDPAISVRLSGNQNIKIVNN